MKTMNLTIEGTNAGTVALADTFFSRLRGLLGRSAKELGGLLITPCSQVHCCFMKEAIDVVYIDRQGQVLRVDASMQPWHFGPLVRGSNKVLELPDGEAEKLDIVPGKYVCFR